MPVDLLHIRGFTGGKTGRKKVYFPLGARTSTGRNNHSLMMDFMMIPD